MRYWEIIKERNEPADTLEQTITKLDGMSDSIQQHQEGVVFHVSRKVDQNALKDHIVAIAGRCGTQSQVSLDDRFYTVAVQIKLKGSVPQIRSCLKRVQGVVSKIKEGRIQEDDAMSGELIVPGKEGILGGDNREGMNTEQAKAYLDQYPDGALFNDLFDRESFVFQTHSGEYRFYHSVKDIVDTWDWSTDVEDMIETPRDQEMLNDWWYTPGEDFAQVNGGIEFFDNLRNGGK